jgi:two-component system CheB/CheR fusion protein
VAPRRNGLEEVIEKIRAARSFDFRNYKRATLRRRIERRMVETRCKSHQEYVALLDASPPEFDTLISSLLIKLTSFFRDREAWAALRKKAIPELLAAHKSGDEIRVWSAGCATGEETYSIAILLAEALGPALGGYPLRVFGTDVDEAAIAHARRGVYAPQQVEEVSRERLTRWFTRVSDGLAVNKDIRRMVVFGINNLVSDAPISRLDLLLCRNVFIYLDAHLQKRVLSRFHYALRSGGLLFLGKSELIPFAAKTFAPVDLSHRLYRRAGRREHPVLTEERIIGVLEQEDVSFAVRQSQEELSALGEFQRDVLNSVSFPIVCTSLDGTVTLWNAAAARSWQRPESDVLGRKLSSLGIRGLPGDLPAEKAAALREGKIDRQVALTELPDAPDGPRIAEVEIAAMRDSGREVAALLYVLRDITQVNRLEQELETAREERDKAIEDLQTANEEFQSSNEELETTNEELQSANEELQTTNEELQSTNEELETTNEELHSTNSELDATNRELAHRTEELNVLGFYHRTIIRSLANAVVVVDPLGRITLWNLAAERLLGLTEAEALGQQLWTLRIPILTRSIVKQMREHISRGVAFRADDLTYERPGGRVGHAAVSIVPLADEDKRELGAVLIVEDTTRAAMLIEERLTEQQPRKAAVGEEDGP